MKNKKLISAILVAASIAGGVVGAQAKTFDEKIADEAKARVASDTMLFNKIAANKTAIDANAKDIATNRDNITKNAGNISDNTIAIQKEAAARRGDIANVNFMAGLERQERENADKKLATDILVEKKNREGAVAMVDNKVNLEKQERENNDAKLDAKIEKEATERKDADQKLKTQIDKNGFKADTALKVIGNGAMQNGATNLTDGVNQNTRLVEAEAKARYDADKAEAKAREDADKAETAARIAGDNELKSRIGQVESDATKGIAKASALAALHPLDYDPDNKFDIAAAGGFYKGENAFALGAFYRPNRNVMLSMGTTLTGDDNAYNVGLTFKIGKSGKHTETGLTTADLYAMIGAMQDKMDQQQKKIEELEAKQAK